MDEYVKKSALYEGAKLKHFQERKIVTKGELKTGLVEYAEETIFLESLLDEIAPMIGANREGGLIPLLKENIGKDYGPWVPFIFVDSFRGTPKKYCRKIPEGDFVCAIYHDYYLKLESNATENIQRFCDENGYEITGDIMSCDVLDVTVTDDFSEMVIELQAPVKKLE